MLHRVVAVKSKPKMLYALPGWPSVPLLLMAVHTIGFTADFSAVEAPLLPESERINVRAAADSHGISTSIRTMGSPTTMADETIIYTLRECQSLTLKDEQFPTD